jgi:hypothetical protein
MAVVLSYLILLTPIVNYPDRDGNYEMAAKVSHYHHMADTPRAYKIAANKARIDEWPPTGIIGDYGHTILEDRSEREGELDGRMTIAFVLDIPQSSAWIAKVRFEECHQIDQSKYHSA